MYGIDVSQEHKISLGNHIQGSHWNFLLLKIRIHNMQFKKTLHIFTGEFSNAFCHRACYCINPSSWDISRDPKANWNKLEHTALFWNLLDSMLAIDFKKFELL